MTAHRTCSSRSALSSQLPRDEPMPSHLRWHRTCRLTRFRHCYGEALAAGFLLRAKRQGECYG